MQPEPSPAHRRCARAPACPWGLCWALGLAIALGPVSAFAGAGAPATVDFGRDILPILSDKCFLCHGPDAKARKAGLRLDTEEGALHAASPVIVPGKSDESELIYRVTSEDASEVMPPPRSNRTLTS